ncbi:hypothetical protein BpHYR1_022684 [Brachionus plicatilis]|uniref:Uncharacterized protein n=1 Tax=Brachionus plicatilis TaxID=10195 RepID=A0A3M7SIW3_BRAPC|nr:hypothetical protein BpHYR1_022684 [Brachionus plicatilis]
MGLIVVPMWPRGTNKIWPPLNTIFFIQNETFQIRPEENSRHLKTKSNHKTLKNVLFKINKDISILVIIPY